MLLLMAVGTMTAGDGKTRLKVKKACMTMEEHAKQLQQRMNAATPINAKQMAKIKAKVDEAEGNWETLLDEDFHASLQEPKMNQTEPCILQTISIHITRCCPMICSTSRDGGA